MIALRTWRYELPYNQVSDGGVFFLESTGLFLASSPYGAYSHRWTHTGSLCIRAFVAQIDAHYAYSKLVGPYRQRLEPFDGYATMLRVRADVFELKFSHPSLFEREIDHLETFGRHAFEDDRAFERWCEDTQLDEYWAYRETARFGECWSFVTKLLPRLQKRLRFDLAREAKAAAPASRTSHAYEPYGLKDNEALRAAGSLTRTR